MINPSKSNKIKLAKGDTLPNSIGWWFGKHPKIGTEWWCRIFEHEGILLVLFPLAGLFKLEKFFENNTCNYNEYDWAGPFNIELQ